MAETIVVERCEGCGVRNHVNLGDPEDLTANDRDGFRCWSCGHVSIMADDELKAWLAESGGHASVEEWAKEGAFIVDGKRPSE